MTAFHIDSSQVTPSGGQPALFQGETRIPPLLYALSDIPGARPWLEPSKTSIAQFHDCGIDLVGVDTDLQSGWQEDGSYDLSPALHELESALAANPHAGLLIRLHLNAPYHWMHNHPHELIAFDSGERTDHGSYGDRVIQYDKFPEIKASIASRVYLHDCGEMLRQFCLALKAHPVGQSIAAIQPAYGLNGEWHQFMVAGGDVGEAMTACFRAYCRKTYPTLDALRAVYGSEAAYETLVLPSAAERDALPRSQWAVDACKVLNFSVSDAISHFAAVIKSAWPEILCGSFYGYFFSVGTVGSGMLEPQTILRDPNIDFLAGPSAYNANKWPGNTPLLRYLPESMRLNGKLFLCEMDQGPQAWGSNAALGLGPSYTAKDEAEYAALLKRNICENLLRGHGAWFYDHRLPIWDIHEKHPYWNHSDRLAAIAKLYAFAQTLVKRPFVKNTDVLLVFDTESQYRDHRSAFMEDTFRVMDTLHKSGAAWDTVYLVDLPRVKLSDYRCVVFVNCSYLTADAEKNIRAALATGIRAVLCDRFAENCGGMTAFAGNTVLLPQLPETPSAWRSLFREAGAHIWCTGDEVLTADNGFVMVHSCGIAETRLQLPHKTILLSHPDSAADTAVVDIAYGVRVL